MYIGGGTRPIPSENKNKRQKENTRDGYGDLKLGSPCLSLAKSTDNDADMIWYQVVASKVCPKAAIVSAQQFPWR